MRPLPRPLPRPVPDQGQPGRCRAAAHDGHELDSGSGAVRVDVERPRPAGLGAEQPRAGRAGVRRPAVRLVPGHDRRNRACGRRRARDGGLTRLTPIPFLFIVLIVAVRCGASVLGLSVIIGAFTWLVPARLVRGEVLTLRTKDFVAAARTAGSGRWRLINRHLIPNALGVIIVNVTFNVADAILAVAALGYLGFGLHYPNEDWGDMLSNGIQYIQDDTGGLSTRSARLSSWWSWPATSSVTHCATRSTCGSGAASSRRLS